MENRIEELTEPKELVPPNIIRVETGLSRYPVHRLAKQGNIAIEILEKSDDGEVLIKWEVSPNGKFGQPGPLAYKLDTLIVNRRIEEAARPIPRIIKLGTLTAIIEELGLTNHDTQTVKRALIQNALAGIVAKLRYKLADGKHKELEAAFTRYSVVFTGEELPDGRRADAVYLVLNDVFIQVINGAQTRPLDYDYLKNLPPASQRLYELLSFQIYATLKHSRHEAKLSYSEFCTYAPLTRFLEWGQVRPQMARLHRPHLKSGYIESVDFEQTADREGRPDWLVVYTPGSKARAEFRAFTKRGGPRTLEIEQAPISLELPSQPVMSPLEQELTSRGVTPSTARELVSEFPADFIATKIEHFDWLKKHRPKAITDSEGGWLTSSIRKPYGTPDKFVSKAEQEALVATRREKVQLEAKAAGERRAESERGHENHKRVLKHWHDLTPDEQKMLDVEAEANASQETRDAFQATPSVLREAYLKTYIRWPYVRQILGLH